MFAILGRQGEEAKMEIPVKYLIVALALAVSPSATSAQEKDQPKTTVQRVPITATATMHGREMFTYYCAVCHGVDARGQAPPPRR